MKERQPTTATTPDGVKRHAAARRKSGASRSLLVPVEPYKGTAPLRSAYIGAVDLAVHLGQAIKQQDHWKRRALHAEALLRRAGKALDGRADLTNEDVDRLLRGGSVSKEAQDDCEARAKVAAEVLTALQLYPHYRLDYRSNMGMVLEVLDYVSPEAAARIREEGNEAAGRIRRDLYPDPEDEETP
jgi:hypothetical protein